GECRWQPDPTVVRTVVTRSVTGCGDIADSSSINAVFFIRWHDETLSVAAMCVCNKDRSALASVTGQRTDRHEWIRDKTSLLTPDVQVRQTRPAFHLHAKRTAFRRRDARQQSRLFDRERPSPNSNRLS